MALPGGLCHPSDGEPPLGDIYNLSDFPFCYHLEEKLAFKRLMGLDQAPQDNSLSL